MKETPLLFTPENVRKVMAGTKTQTRRIVKPQPPQDAKVVRYAGEQANYCSSVDDKPSKNDRPQIVWSRDGKAFIGGPVCPYGQSGDRLWVRESIFIDHWKYMRGLLPKEKPADLDMEDVYYRADGDCCKQISECACAEVGKPPCRPSIHMPKWACRLWLELTAVRVERVQEISREDVIAEGVTLGQWSDPVSEWGARWTAINGKESWEQNPWVWVLTFQFAPQVPS